MSDEEVPPAMYEAIKEHIETQHGYLSWLGVRVDDLTYGTATLTIPFDETLTNQPDPPTMHGGVAATLIDTAGGLSLRPMLSDPASDGMATVNLNVNYLRPAANDLTATAEVIRAGSTIGVSDVIVESETPEGETKAVAAGQAAYRLFQGG